MTFGEIIGKAVLGYELGTDFRFLLGAPRLALSLLSIGTCLTENPLL